MVKLRKLSVSAAAAVLAAVCVLSGCGDSTDSAEETSEESTDEGDAESSDEEEDESTAQINADQEKIDALDPQKPDDMGTVDNLTYKQLSFEVTKEAEITDEDVLTYLESSILPYSPIEITDGEVQDGDTVNINYVGKIDGEEFDGGSADGYELTIGSGTFIDGFEDGLIGTHYGETVTLNLTFPEDYSSDNTELNGKDVEFTVDINSISRTLSLDEFDDAAAAEISEDDSMTAEEYKKEIKEFLENNAELTFKSGLYNAAISAAVEASSIEPGDDAVEWQLDSALTNYDKNLQYQGWNLAYYLYMLGTDYDSFRSDLREQAVEAAKEVVLRYAICDAEGIEYNDDTLQQYLDEFGYTEEQLDQVASEADKESAVIWYMAGKTITDSANITFVDDADAEEETAEAAEEEAEETEASEEETTEAE